MWVVYIVECRDKTYYTGITSDLEKRVKAHNEGKGAKYTRGRGPVKVVFEHHMTHKGAALSFEKAIKRMDRQGKKLLVKAWKKETLYGSNTRQNHSVED